MNRYPADWPQGLIDVAEVIGAELALVLAGHVGGVAQYVPMHPESGHKLVKYIGLPALRLLSKVYGGDWLTVPKYAAGKSKRVKIKRLLNEGTSFRETALNADATVRYVTMVARDLRQASQQGSLFDI